MARRVRSNTSSSSKDATVVPTTIEGTPAPTATSDTDIDIKIDLFPSEDSTDFTALLDQEKKMPAAANEATRAVYEEHLLDCDDDELIITTTTNDNPIAVDNAENSASIPADGNEQEDKAETEERVENAETAQAKPEAHFEHAKLAMIWCAQTMLTQSADMAAALQLNDVGETVAVNVTANGVTYEITWKVTSFVDSEDTEGHTTTSSLRDAAPLTKFFPTAPQANIKYKFGRNCKNGVACPLDHTIKPKLCGFVNTSRGCTNTDGCEFSHENEGVNCTRSALRNTCANGRGCTFKHGDDWVKEVKVEEKTEEKSDVAKDAPPANAPSGPKVVNVEVAPTGPKGDGPKQIAGQKHGRGDEEDVGNAPKGPRLAPDGGNNHRGDGRQTRGRGRGRGQGRGRGGGPGLRIRGAASKGQV